MIAAPMMGSGMKAMRGCHGWEYGRSWIAEQAPFKRCIDERFAYRGGGTNPATNAVNGTLAVTLSAYFLTDDSCRSNVALSARGWV